MKTCDCCKYWDDCKDPEWIKYKGNHGICSCEKFVESVEVPKDGLAYCDYEGWSASFLTGPKFGCIHWTER